MNGSTPLWPYTRRDYSSGKSPPPLADIRVTPLVLADAGALCTAALGLGSEPAAQSGDEAAIAQAIEGFRTAMLAADRSQFKILCADQLSYSHSAGKIETKAQFIDGAVSGRSVWKFITLTDQSRQIVGNNAIGRHLLTGET
jgi:Domain of unknown function (DUF4440)